MEKRIRISISISGRTGIHLKIEISPALRICVSFFYDILKIEKQIHVFAGDFMTNGIILNHDVFHYFSGKVKGDAEFGTGTA